MQAAIRQRRASRESPEQKLFDQRERVLTFSEYGVGLLGTRRTDDVQDRRSRATERVILIGLMS